ncbi:MAG: GTPase [Patescibacteria group bacterium]
MDNTNQQIADIEKELRELPHHKATDHYIGRLRAKLARLKDKEIETQTKNGGGGGDGYAVKKQGDATVVLIGPPSAGKSTLINLLTNAQSKVAPYAFTTLTVIPGMMTYKNARIQILDVPGLIEGAEEGKGRGREVLSVARGADLLLIMSDVKRIEAIERIEKTLNKNGIRINQTPPLVEVEKKLGGGLAIHSNLRQTITNETIKEVASEYGIKNGEITIKEKLTFDRLIDAFSRNRVYTPSLSVVNKVDSYIDLGGNKIGISATKEIGIKELKEKIWHTLNFVRIYLNTKDPMVVKEGTTLIQVVQSIGPEFAQSKTGAKIWGPSAKFPGQEVSLYSKVSDEMQIRFV